MQIDLGENSLYIYRAAGSIAEPYIKIKLELSKDVRAGRCNWDGRVQRRGAACKPATVCLSQLAPCAPAVAPTRPAASHQKLWSDPVLPCRAARRPERA